MAQHAGWYRLDNIGTYYAAETVGQMQSVFRLSATLDKPIEPDALQKALNTALDFYPNFNVTLRTGFFWHYLEQRTEPIIVEPEKTPICMPLAWHFRSPLLRVSYYRNRINFEVSHIVSDGRGSLIVFEDLLALYCAAVYSSDTQPVLHAHSTTPEVREEDSYRRNYSKTSAKFTAKKRPYHIKSRIDIDRPTYLEIHVPTASVIKLAKEWGVTVSSVFAALVIKAIVRTCKSGDLRKPIRIVIPVDLRPLYNSQTTRNFFGLTTVDYQAKDVNCRMRDIAQVVARQLKENTQPAPLKARMNNMLRLEMMPVSRFSPILLKDIAVCASQHFVDKNRSATTSNLGIVPLDECAASHVQNVNVLTTSKNINFCACSYKNDMSLTISSVYKKDDVIKAVLDEICTLDAKIIANSTTNIALGPIATQARAQGKLVLHSRSVFPHERFSKPRATAVTTFNLATLGAAVGMLWVSAFAQLPFFVTMLVLAALLANYLFVRNILRRSPGFVKAASRYFYALTFICLCWFMLTHFAGALEIALPILGITGIAFDAIILIILKTLAIQDYTKYLIGDVMVSWLPLILYWLGVCSLNPLIIVCASLGCALLCGVALFGRKTFFKELRRTLNA